MIAADLTLVVVGYKHQAYVRTLLESIERQTVQPARVILIDDDPAGLTAAAAADYLASSELSVEVRTNPTNLGLCANLNAALAEIETEFYAYISADDWMMPARFEKQIELLRESGERVALVYSNAVRVDEDDREHDLDFRSAYDWPAHRTGNVFEQLLQYNWLPAPSVLLRTQAVKDIGGYDPDLFFEDHDLFLRLARAHEFECVEEHLVAFRELSSSLGHQEFQTDNPRFVLAYVQILSKQLGYSTRLDEEIIPKLWSLSLRLWRIEGATPRVKSYLSRFKSGAKNQFIGQSYSALARAGLGYSHLDSVRRVLGR